MAKSAFGILKQWKPGRPKRTSIGRSRNTRPTNKHKIKGWKKYRGQGK